MDKLSHANNDFAEHAYLLACRKAFLSSVAMAKYRGAVMQGTPVASKAAPCPIPHHAGPHPPLHSATQGVALR